MSRDYKHYTSRDGNDRKRKGKKDPRSTSGSPKSGLFLIFLLFLGIGFGAYKLSPALSQRLSDSDYFSISGVDVSDVDVTHLTSTQQWMEFIGGLKDPGTLDCEILYEKDELQKLYAAMGRTQTWTITFPDTSTFVCDGYVKSAPIEIPRDDAMVCSASIKLSGKPTYTPAT